MTGKVGRACLSYASRRRIMCIFDDQSVPVANGFCQALKPKVEKKNVLHQVKLKSLPTEQKILKSPIGIFAALIFVTIFVSCGPRPSVKAPETPSVTSEKRQKEIILAADKALKEKKYRTAFRYLNFLLNNDPHSSFADDAAYRLAYLHVVADSGNPYFDYAQALKAFKRFKKNYPQSIYSSACNNWLKILYLFFDLKRESVQLRQKNQNMQKMLRRLKNRNTELERTLKDLEHVIKRNQ